MTPNRKRTLTALGMTFLAALVTWPLLPAVIPANLDGSWVLGLNWAHAHGIPHDGTMAWSHGPLGYLLMAADPSGAMWTQLWFRLALFALLLAGLFRIVAGSVRTSLGVWAAAVLTATVVVNPLAPPDRLDAAILAWALLPFVAGTRFRYAEMAVLGVLAALALLVKFNVGIQAALLWGWALALTVWRDRSQRRPWRLAAVLAVSAFPAALAAFYGLVSRQITGLPAYLRYSWEVAAGYQEAMWYAGPGWEVVLMLSALVVVFGVPLASGLTPRWLPGLVPAGIVAFFTFKYAAIRQDEHTIVFFPMLAAASLFLLLGAAESRGRRLIAALQVMLLLAGYINVARRRGDMALDILDTLALGKTVGLVSGYLNWPRLWREHQGQTAANLAALKLSRPVSAAIGKGTVDAVPMGLAEVWANGWTWSPRPVMQAYSAYTPLLDALNARHLAGAGAADFQLVRWSLIDGKNPFLNDPLSWRAMLERYEFRLMENDVLLLGKRAVPQPAPVEPAGRARVRWGQELPVPAGDGVLLAADVSRSLWGTIRGALYRVNPVSLEVRYAFGGRMQSRTVRANLASGVPVGLPRDLVDLAVQFGACQTLPDRVTSVRFLTSSPEQYRDEIDVTWLRSTSRGCEPAPWTGPRHPLWLPGRPNPAVNGGEIVSGGKVLKVKISTIDTQVLFPVDSTVTRFDTLLVRARFSKTDRIDLFFHYLDGIQNLPAKVPAAGRWLDIVWHVGRNPWWKKERGPFVRFDPSWEGSVGSEVEIAGVWGGDSPASPSLPVEFRPVKDQP